MQDSREMEMSKLSVLIFIAALSVGLCSGQSVTYAQTDEEAPPAADQLEPPDQGVDEDQGAPDGVEVPPEEGVGPPIEVPPDEGAGPDMPPDEDSDQLPDPDQE
jgi:hypothetical protein